ncbi:hypothetical protein WDU94_013626 [Cyamophila willieti]
MSFVNCVSSLLKFNLKNGGHSVSKTFSTINIMSKRSSNKILTMNRKFKIQGLDQHSNRFTAANQFDMIHSEFPFNMMLWRTMCSNPGAKHNENDDIKYSLKKEDLANIRRGMSGKTPLKDGDIEKHNKHVLKEMDKMIKKNIDAIENEWKNAKMEGSPKVKTEKSPKVKAEGSPPISEESPFNKYGDMILKYSPVKIASPQEFQTMVAKEFEQFKMSDLNQVPNHVMIIAFGGLVPFLIPLVDVILVHGYTPGMEFLQTTYSSLLLTTLGGVHLTSCVQSIINNQVCKEDIPTIVYPFTLSWLSLLVPSLGLVLNSTGLILLFSL